MSVQSMSPVSITLLPETSSSELKSVLKSANRTIMTNNLVYSSIKRGQSTKKQEKVNKIYPFAVKQSSPCTITLCINDETIELSSSCPDRASIPTFPRIDVYPGSQVYIYDPWGTTVHRALIVK